MTKSWLDEQIERMGPRARRLFYKIARRVYRTRRKHEKALARLGRLLRQGV